MQSVESIIKWFATNELALGLATITGLISFVLSIIVSFRTAKISRILKYNDLTDAFNKERKALYKTVMGHRDSILIDGTKTDVTRNNILLFVSRCSTKYKPLMSWRVRFTIWKLKRLLKQPNIKIKYNAVVDHLAELAAWLDIEEERKNG